MKNTNCILLLFVLALFNSCSADDDIIIHERVYVEEFVVEKSNRHIAFPTIAKKDNESKILIAYREGDSHASFDGKIIQKESYDYGKTWINKKIIYQSDLPTEDARDPQFLVLPNGNLICRLFVRSDQTNSVVKIIQSSDWGENYEFISNLPMPYPGETYMASRGNMLIVGDTIYSSVYNRWHNSWILKSNDWGKTWNFSSWLDRSDKTISGIHRELNESSLCFQDKKMYVVARSSSFQPRKLTVTESQDSAKTWINWSELPVCGHAPSLTPYKDAYILSYRNINTSENQEGKIQFDCALFSKGQLISSPITLISSKSNDIGYGDVITYNSFFLLCCYTGNTIHCFKVEYDIFSS